MIRLQVEEKDSDILVQVIGIHYQPDLIDSSVNTDFKILYNGEEPQPDPEQLKTKSATLMYNKETKQLFYKYEDRQPTPEELKEQEYNRLKQDVLTAQEAVAQVYELLLTEHSQG